MPVVNHSLQLIAIEFVVHNSCCAALQRGEIIDYVQLLCVWLIAKFVFSHNDCEILFNNYFLMRCLQSRCVSPSLHPTEWRNRWNCGRTKASVFTEWDWEVRQILRQISSQQEQQQRFHVKYVYYDLHLNFNQTPCTMVKTPSLYVKCKDRQAAHSHGRRIGNSEITLLIMHSHSVVSTKTYGNY